MAMAAVGNDRQVLPTTAHDSLISDMMSDCRCLVQLTGPAGWEGGVKEGKASAREQGGISNGI